MEAPTRRSHQVQNARCSSIIGVSYIISKMVVGFDQFCILNSCVFGYLKFSFQMQLSVYNCVNHKKVHGANFSDIYNYTNLFKYFPFLHQMSTRLVGAATRALMFQFSFKKGHEPGHIAWRARSVIYECSDNLAKRAHICLEFPLKSS